MTKPRLAKVRALFYVLQQVTKEAAPILTQPLGIIEHFPFSEILYGAFKAQPTEDYMLLLLVKSHVCLADIIFLVIFFNCYLGITLLSYG